MVSTEATRWRIGSLSPDAIRRPAFSVIDRIQHFDPAAQITGTAVALCAMVEACGLSMRDVIVVAENTLRDCEGPYTETIQAIRAYAHNEITRRGE